MCVCLAEVQKRLGVSHAPHETRRRPHRRSKAVKQALVSRGRRAEVAGCASGLVAPKVVDVQAYAAPAQDAGAEGCCTEGRGPQGFVGDVGRAARGEGPVCPTLVMDYPRCV